MDVLSQNLRVSTDIFIILVNFFVFFTVDLSVALFFRLKSLLGASRNRQSQVFSKQIDISTESEDDGLYVERIRVENMTLGFELDHSIIWLHALMVRSWISLTREGPCFLPSNREVKLGHAFCISDSFIACFDHLLYVIPGSLRY